MEKSMRRYMRVGTILHVSYKQLGSGEGPILECLKKIVTDPYFEVVEVTHMKDAEVRKAAADMIARGHMTSSYGGQGRMLGAGLNINDLNEEGRQKALASLKEGIDEAYEMGVEDFAFLAGRYEEKTKEESFQALLKSTRELCEYAKSKGDMPVLCEVFDYDIAKKSLIGPVDMVKRYAETICAEYDNFGLMVDLSHIPMLHETIEESLLPVQQYIRHAHMGNTVIKSPECPAYGDEHPRFGFPNSENDVEELAAYLRLLLKIGFLNEKKRPIVSFEIKPFGEEDPEVCLANAKRTLDLAWELV
ncbi:TIM barrel protein [Hominiventricola filiformis]|uniref:Sugar phosphate isomerase/epimerase n=1 Tax=Hominiventricola filiformis TaxID=2885352 RepID=A0AAE3DAA2_9FIRM|nr:TIM barrel protein [Hominiventricola filiformis]MCC2124880.1 sugar phosphate isomerase/epimerase [Hominiventricola filiformis]